MEWSNFGSFEGDHSFTFAESGMHHIIGINQDSEGDSSFNGRHSVGSGKSTLTTIPEFALYGNIAKGSKKDQIINKAVGRDLRAALYFSVNDTDYLVERFRKHREGKSGLFLWEKIGGEWVNQTQSDIAATQQAINNIILINEETFLKTVLLSREDLQQFLDYSPAERWKIFESIIQLDKLKKYQDIVNKKQKEYQLGFDTIRTQVASENALFNHITKQIKELKESNNWKKQKLEKELTELKTTVEHEDLNSLIEKLEKIHSLAEIIYRYSVIKRDAEKEVEHVKDKIIAHQKTLTSYEQNIKQTKQQLENLTPITCHNCGEIQNKESYEKQLQQLQNHLDIQNQHIESCSNELEDLRLTYASLHGKINTYTDLIEKYEEEYDAIDVPEQYKDDISFEVQAINISSIISNLKKIDEQIASIQTELLILDNDL